VEIALQSFPEGLVLFDDLPHVLPCLGSTLLDDGSRGRFFIGLEDARQSAPWLGLKLIEDLVELGDPLFVVCDIAVPAAEEPVQARPQYVRRLPLQYERVDMSHAAWRGLCRLDRHVSSRFPASSQTAFA